MNNGAIETGEHFPQISASVFVMRESELLLVKRDHEPDINKWELPGGKVNAFEGIFAAGQREVTEETGQTVTIENVLFISELVRPEENRHKLYVFLEGKLTEPRDLVNGDGVVESRWVDVRKLGDLEVEGGVTDVAYDALIKFSKIVKARQQQMMMRRAMGVS